MREGYEEMNNNMPIIFIIGLILSLFIHKYLHLDQYPILGKVTMPLIIFTLIGTIFFIFTSINFGGVDYGWQVDYMNYERLHEYSTGKSQRIALIDSGVSDFQMKKNINNSITLVGDNNDNNGHGTIMYSIIKGDGKNILGIAPDAYIISIKVMDSDESINPSLMAKAIEDAINLDSTVINISIGSYKFNQEVSDMIDVALKKGITVVASSGDYAAGDMMFPANKRGVISVGSISANKRVSDFTNASNETTINAPGDEIKSITRNQKVEINSGTSQSAAIVSGYVCLLKDYAFQKKADLSNDKILKLLTSINGKTKYTDVFSEIE